MKNLDGLNWSKYILALTPKERKRLKDKLVESVRYYNATWSKGKDGKSKVVKYDKDSQALYKLLKSRQVNFRGFSPIVRYIKENGPKDDLTAHFNHPWAIPSMLFDYKGLPVILTTNPALRFDTSILNEIDDNRHLFVELDGYTG